MTFSKRILSLFLCSLILYTINSNVYIFAQSQIGVKAGDYVKYDVFFSNTQTWDNMDEDIVASMINHNYTILPRGDNGILITKTQEIVRTLNIIETDGNLIEFEIVRGINGSERITADPTVSNDDPPMHLVHIYFMPVGLGIGDFAPLPPYINDTVKITGAIERTVNGVTRTLNHYSFVKVESGTGSNGPWSQVYERDAYFDRETGVMVESILVYTKIVYDESSNISMIFNEVYSFKIKETNIWRTSLLNNNLLVPSIAVILVAALIFIYYYTKTGRRFR